MKIAARFGDWQELATILKDRTDFISVQFRARIQYRLAVEEARHKLKTAAAAARPDNAAKLDDAFGGDVT